MTGGAYIAAPAPEIYWRYEVPTRTDAKVLLLTIGRTAVVGNWCGLLGESFVAWAPLPRRDKAAETRLGLMPGHIVQGAS